MARWEFKLPDIGEGVTEGEIVQFLVQQGDVVTEDQPMIEVMTDKATVTIGAPRAGRIAELRGQPGQVVAVHSVLVVFDLDGAPAPAAANGEAKVDAGPAATAVGDIKEDLPGMGHALGVPAAAMPGGILSDKPLATPATRKLARDLGVDLRRVPATGRQGHVTKQDVRAFHGVRGVLSGPGGVLSDPDQAPVLSDPDQAPVLSDPTGAAGVLSGAAGAPGVLSGAARAAGVLSGAAGAPGVLSGAARASGALEHRVPFVGMRRKIAAKMQQSKNTAAHFTFVEECDAGPLMALRARLKGPAERQGVKLTFLSFIVKAVVAALQKHPVLNSTLDENTSELVYHRTYNIGIAASTDAGLIVPVVKNADGRSLLDVAREIERLAADAKAGKSRLEDLTGSTFTITSLGAEGGYFATPILNFPEVGILGVHRIKERPVVKDGAIVIGNVMLLSLSFDHRIVDGAVGAAFAYEVIRILEEPETLFLSMV